MSGGRLLGRVCVSIATVLAIPTAGALAAVTFMGLGFLPGETTSVARDVSGDGSVVVGVSGAGFRWSDAGGMQGYGTFPGASRVGPLGVSRDGTAVVGQLGFNTGARPLAFRWTEATGIHLVGSLPGGLNLSFGSGVSGDGSVVVGGSQSGDGDEAFRWTQAGGIQSLGAPPLASFATDASMDGSVVVGQFLPAIGEQSRAFRWTPTSAFEPLAGLAGQPYSSAAAVSQDGSTIVGVGGTNPSGANERAIRWTSETGPMALDLLPNHTRNRAVDVSGDGSVVVGTSNGPGELTTFLWDTDNGMRKLTDVLTAGGADLTGWTTIVATGISDDGGTIVGGGTKSSGRQEAWIARLLPPQEFVWSPDGLLAFWEHQMNWEPEGVPGGRDTAVFRGANYTHNVQIDVNASVGTLRVEGTGTTKFETGNGPRRELNVSELVMGTRVLDDVTLELEDFSLRVHEAKLGNADGALAKLVVKTGGSFAAETLRVGAEEKAEMVIDSGGSATVDNVFIARNDGNGSQVTIRNGGSMTVDQELRIGDGRPGKLVLESGGRLIDDSDTDSVIGLGSEVRLDGAGTRWSGLLVGGPISGLAVNDGSFEVLNHATAELFELAVTGSDVNTLASVRVATQGVLDVQQLTLATLAEGDVAVVIEADSKLKAKDIVLGSNNSSTAPKTSLWINGSGASAEISGDVTIDALNVENVGASTIDLTNGAKVVQTGALTRVNDRGELKIEGNGSSWTNMFGDLTVDGGEVHVLDGAEATFDKVNLFGGAGSFVDAGRVFVDNATMTADDLVTVGGETEGRISLINGVVNAGTEVLITENGSIIGAGSVNSPFVHGPGFISPGLSPGTLTINGDLQLDAGGMLEIEFAGLTPDAEHDVLVVNGDMTIAGEVLLTFIDGFAPSQGDEFEFLVTSGVTDLAAAQFEVQNLLPGFQFDIMTSPTGIMLMALTDGTFAYNGDTNSDGLINIDDLNNVRNNFGGMGDPDGSLPGDAFPFNGLVNIDDLNAVRNNFGAGAAVPEPVSGALMLCAAMVFVALTSFTVGSELSGFKLFW